MSPLSLGIISEAILSLKNDPDNSFYKCAMLFLSEMLVMVKYLRLENFKILLTSVKQIENSKCKSRVYIQHMIRRECMI